MTALKILGIDPGFESMGVAVCQREADGRLSLCEAGVIGSAADAVFSKRLLELSLSLKEFIQGHTIAEAAVEKIFFQPSWKTGVRVAEARGVILRTLAEANLPVFEYAPTEIKRAITGNGRSHKDVVAMMVMKVCSLRTIIPEDNAADAAAIALTHLLTKRGAHFSREVFENDLSATHGEK